MGELRLVNDNGLATLKNLADASPRLFLDAEPDKLIEAMEERMETSDLWDEPLTPSVLKDDLSPLNDTQVKGPGADAEHARLVRNALGHLSPYNGLNEHLWATINCFVLPRYVPIRWESSAQSKDPKKLPNFVQNHWLKGGLTAARRANAIARLWWLNEFSSRAAKHSDLYDADELLDAMAKNVNLYHQFLSRPNLLSRSKLVAAIYEVFLEPDNEYLNITTYASRMMETLNIRAAHESLDLMDISELRETVEEAKPPKDS